MGDKTDLKRDILLELQDDPDATNTEIADAVGCSASYVSQVKNEFDDYNALDAAQDDVDKRFDEIEDDLDDLGF